MRYVPILALEEMSLIETRGMHDRPAIHTEWKHCVNKEGKVQFCF